MTHMKIYHAGCDISQGNDRLKYSVTFEFEELSCQEDIDFIYKHIEEKAEKFIGPFDKLTTSSLTIIGETK